MMDIWFIRSGLLGLALCVLAVGVYAVKTAPAANPDYVREIHIEPPNPLGDSDYACKTMYCNDTDHYIGLQTRNVYVDRWHMQVGLASGKKALLNKSFGTPDLEHARRFPGWRVQPPKQQSKAEPRSTYAVCC